MINSNINKNLNELEKVANNIWRKYYLIIIVLLFLSLMADVLSEYRSNPFFWLALVMGFVASFNNWKLGNKMSTVLGMILLVCATLTAVLVDQKIKNNALDEVGVYVCSFVECK